MKPIAEDSQVLERWIRASFAIGRVGQDPLGGHLAYQIQAVGRLDVRLRVFDLRLVPPEPPSPALVPHISASSAEADNPQLRDAIHLTEYLDFSRLWVLDAYELMRTLDACVTAGLWAPSKDVQGRAKSVKGQLAEVRVPLAKLEPAGWPRSARPGDLIPEAVLVPGAGAAWNVGVTAVRIVTRRALADALLSVLETARADSRRARGDPDDPA